ncbi:nitrogenase-stabilizing/protective protein NifW [Candidatus Mycolicibacterium alkanivorans]|uniref:Nitrogenase-stabilizing/protective protein NifW n=1 Tax=Candidatus Mycolicibacterium alkanivorans TaxID=2954114 RepID=A0ABS9YQV8_9MYCO|nr:nitrogenase-stabilizing/protective protein NifW [Candidatus Mycolicibacterium alkanivorans]MCI4673633.1 nitrogenase-stabilizing/protective protein NifW [Candidatus Mycolicibacterium alkanivorans]
MTTATDGLAAFRQCETAEDYFAFFGLSYDPAVVNVNRLHILKHFARQLADLHAHRSAPEPTEQILADYRDALVAAYQAFTTGTALEHRVFKVLQDHAPRAFVPIGEVTVRTTEGRK